ncbi:Ser-Thr-rich glycosyl-phosphatidyl-inositol-anchored membrane family-domain-containing protein [Massariosphaeria phaeospora]|uniref:Ser-Thr-rich glycosyl-phosphatidyl-inositol-anchored membrane family-domain-containing protein n=1 Tax=Massariosphaeria phaeospora TaxID=100035 RepID=A0A7C8MA24_9PLEO|nr:Ser-Thr-rich glycosyl-phosphatidyl-inositol-anchored membrane family-domain-containing protein [Massariosphaeria phaeospora]
MFSKTSTFALFAAVASAQLHAPTGEPKGNAILSPLNEIVPACKPFTITWEPTTYNTVSVLLLKGPSTNVVKFGPALAEGIVNSGSLTFTPSKDLETTNGSPTGYGIQLIDDVTGEFQYSTQFGISNEDCDVESSSSAAGSSSAGGYPTASETVAVTTGKSHENAYTSGHPMPTEVASSANGTSVHASSAGTASHIVISSVHAGNSTIIQPTKTPTVPASLQTYASQTGSSPSTPTGPSNGTTTAPPESTGAASSLRAGLSLVGAAAGLAFML